MAVSQVQACRLDVEGQFNNLETREKLYAHHMARAAWHGARIIMRQVSPESESIFDFIIGLHAACSGRWDSLAGENIELGEVQSFLKYAATFLSNVGNYFGSGDQKFTPAVDPDVLQRFSSKSPELERLYGEIADSIYSTTPRILGYPSENSQSSYYPGPAISEAEVAVASKILEQHSIFPENTRIRRSANGTDLEVLLASVDEGPTGQIYALPSGSGNIHVIRGDYSAQLKRVCEEIHEAIKYAANARQRDALQKYIDSFETGSMDRYRDALRMWVKDMGPRVENIFGFVEPYRDPHGTRAEFEGLVGIADDDETKLFAKLVAHSAKFIRRLPWATPENDGRGPFEKSLFEPPDFSSIHTLAYCSSIVFPGINVPNFNDIRQETGFKNLIIANRMKTESFAQQYPFIDATESAQFRKHKHPAYYWWVVLHELLGHGTGQMMIEGSSGSFNFDIEKPPISPLTGKPITSWYRPGQTWTGQFGDLATTVDECRAELVGAYLMDDVELLALFGFTEESDITATDLTYNLYQQLGVDGLRGLTNFNSESGKWGQAHSRAHFAMLKCLLLDGGGCVSVVHDREAQSLTVHVDRSKMISHGKPALGQMLLRLHMYRCTADVEACRTYYEDLTRVDGEYLAWREVAIANKPPPMVFAHTNTFLEGDTVVLKEYDATVEGIVQSWAERDV